MLFWLIAGPEWANCQQYILKNYGLSDGLPSKVVYDLAIGRNGLLWIAAEGGLLTYDGSQFTIDPVPQLANTEILTIDLMRDGSLLCLDLNGRLINIIGQQVLDLMPAKEMTNFHGVKAKENVLGELLVFRGYNYWLWSEKNLEKRKLIKKGRLSQIDWPHEIELINDTVFVVNTKSQVLFIDNYKIREYTKPKQLWYMESMISILNNNLIFSAHNKFWTLDPITFEISPTLTQLTNQIDEELLGLWPIGQKLWIDTRSKIYEAQIIDGKWKVTLVIKNVIPGKIIQDWQGNTWLTSITDGLFCVPDQAELLRFFVKESDIDKVTADPSGNIYCHTSKGRLEKYNTDLQLGASILTDNNTYKTYFLEYDQYSDQIYFGTNQTAVFSKDLKFNNLLWVGTSPKALSASPAGTIVVSDAAGGIINRTGGQQKVLNQRCYSHLIIDEELIYFGTIDGLYEYNNGNESVKILEEFDYDIRSLAKDKYDRIWIGTQGNGVHVWNKMDESLTLIDHEKGLLDNRCKKILIDENSAWVSSARGITKISIDDFNEVFILKNEIGLPEGGVNDFTQRKNDLVIATEDGLLLVDKMIGNQKDSLRLNYLSFEYNGEVNAPKDSILLKKDWRGLKFNFQGIDFKNFGAIIYSYKLEGIDQDWVSTQAAYVQYSSLPAGIFKFYLKAKSPNCIEISLPTILIEVPKKFKETFWYALVIFLLSALVVAGIVWYFFKNYQERNQFEKQINEARLSAIRSKMNPHFVFNAINSIQDFVMNNNKRDANRYLVTFSRLMRNVLNASTRQFVTLEEELNTLELYLSLEQLRFDHELETFIEVDNSVNKNDVLLPPMLLQPHVENALKHGLMHKLGKGMLKIRIFARADYLQFEIEDDGVGRTSAAEFGKQRRPEGYVSQGSELVKDQIKLVNIITGKVNTVEINDLYDKDGKAVGTKVVIKFYEAKFKDSLARAGHINL